MGMGERVGMTERRSPGRGRAQRHHFETCLPRGVSDDQSEEGNICVKMKWSRVALRGKGSAIHFFFIFYSHSTDGTQSYATTGDPRVARQTISRPRARCRCPASFRAQNSNSEFPFAPNHWLSSLPSSVSLWLPVSVLSVLVASPPLPSSPFHPFPDFLLMARRSSQPDLVALVACSPSSCPVFLPSRRHSKTAKPRADSAPSLRAAKKT